MGTEAQWMLMDWNPAKPNAGRVRKWLSLGQGRSPQENPIWPTLILWPWTSIAQNCHNPNFCSLTVCSIWSRQSSLTRVHTEPNMYFIMFRWSCICGVLCNLSGFWVFIFIRPLHNYYIINKYKYTMPKHVGTQY